MQKKDVMKKKEELNLLDLDYSKLEKAEIVTHLNRILASYYLYTHKLRYFIWIVEGQDCFDLRQNFRDLHAHGSRHMDEIALRIRLFNQLPVGMLGDLVKISEVEENWAQLTGFEMVKAIVKDINILVSLQSDSIEKAQELHDHGSESMMKQLVRELETDYLLLKSWLK
jgi:starvation-inducible DNA-binding protein